LTTTTLQSSRFGAVEIDERAIIEFPDGLIGLGGTHYALLATDADSPFTWLHSIDDPDLALPLTNPHRFFADFELQLDESEAQRLEIDDAASVDVYVTVRAAAAREDFAVNLRAPIIVHQGRGHQVINQASNSPLRAPLFGA
jgi:flagellar assembly factor FliW